MTFPETPDIRASVGARLRGSVREENAARAPGPRLGFRPLRVWAAGLGIAGAAIVVAVTLISRSGSASLSAEQVLSIASQSPATPGQVTHLVYQVTVDRHGHLVTGDVNVWSGSVGSSFTSVVVDREPALSAERFVRHGASVRRVWVSSGSSLRDSVAGSLATTPFSSGDGRLVAATVLREVAGEHWTASHGGEIRIGPRRAIIISLARPGSPGGQLTMWFDSKTYVLVAYAGNGYSAHLISRDVLADTAAPQLIATYLRANQAVTPPPPSSGAAY
jgi:hypothetical protein